MMEISLYTLVLNIYKDHALLFTMKNKRYLHFEKNILNGTAESQSLQPLYFLTCPYWDSSLK